MEQDWKPVVLKKKLDVKTEHRSQFEEKHKEKTKLESDDPEPPKTLTLKTGQQIQQARCKLGLTQVQLAGKIAVDQATIRDYESGTAIPERSVLNKLNRILKIKIVFV